MSADTSREGQASSRGAEGETKDNITCRAHGKTMCRDCIVVGSKHTCQAMWGTDVELKCGHTAPVLAEACDLVSQMKSKMQCQMGSCMERK